MTSHYVPTRHCAAKSFIFSYSVFTILESRYYPHFTDEKNIVYGGDLTCPKSYNSPTAELRFKTRTTGSHSLPSNHQMALPRIHATILRQQYYLPLTLSISFSKTGTIWYFPFESPKSSGEYLEHKRRALVQKVNLS